MALTRSQLLAGNSLQGVVLPGVQGVSAGSGVLISNTGVLSINGNDPSFNGFIKTNNINAYNAYIWPVGDGTLGQQLTTNGSGTLSWSDPDGIPWTTKGQIVVAAGPAPAQEVLLNVGPNTSFLIADSSTASGLNYTNLVATAALLPGGTTVQRPSSPGAGQVRYNATINEFEGYNGGTTAWQYFSSMPTGPVVPTTGGVDKIFYQNAQIVTEDYTTPTTANSLSAGPITIATGKTVTVPVGSTWTII